MRWWSVVVVALVSLSEVSAKNFLYFAYGSNLLAERIHINNPTAEFMGAASLDDYRLDFIMNSTYWRGAVATIVPDTAHSAVWGALWHLNMTNLASLDRQEGVHLNWYFAKQVVVTTTDGQVIVARTYEQTVNPEALVDREILAMERRPSVTYLKVIIQGAIECGIPEDYIRYLHSVPHNGLNASPEVLERVGDLDAVNFYPSRFFRKRNNV